MASAEKTRPKSGDKVVLADLPPGLFDDLPSEDQQAITHVVGKPILLTGYDEDGRAELEIRDDAADFRFICVSPECISKAVSLKR